MRTLLFRVGAGVLLLTSFGCAGRAPLSVAAEDAPPPGWLARAQASIAAREYQASEDAAGLQAPNRRQNLRTLFAPGGIRVLDRTAPGSPQLFTLALASVGREASRQRVPAGRTRAQGAHVELVRPGLIEWYENRPEGLEQGFTLAERPDGEGALLLELELRGARVARGEPGLVFETQQGRRLGYGALAAWDDEGRELPARFETAGASRFAIAVDDAGARYPLSIDPLLFDASDADTALAGDQLGAAFGASVASAGDVDGDGFGDLIVGAPQYDAGEEDEGAAFVFLGSATGVASGVAGAASAQLEGDQDAAHLGDSVAAAGDVDGDDFGDVIVGAPEYDSGETNEGAAFLFLGSATGIASAGAGSAAARFESDQPGASLGVSVASAGDVDTDGYSDLILGAPDYDGSATDEGAAFLFLGSATGIAGGGAASASATLSGGQQSALLGSSVAAAGDVNGDLFGDVIAGAPNFDAGQMNEGAAFVFLGSATGIESMSAAAAHAQLEGDQAGAVLGISVASAGDVDGDTFDDVIAGAPRYTDGQFLEGAAFVFRGSATGIADAGAGAAAARLEGGQIGAQFGVSVASAGDLSLDGRDDVVVGSSAYSVDDSVVGGAFVFLGSASGITSASAEAASTRFAGLQPLAFFGSSAAPAGDIDGDEIADLVIGAPFESDGADGEGTARIFLPEPQLAAGFAAGFAALAALARRRARATALTR